MEINYKGVIIETIKGDITEVYSDAIVNPTNTNLDMNSEVGRAIKKKIGNHIEEKVKNLGPIVVGKVIFTEGESLSAKYIIHAADMDTDMMTDIIKITDATKNCLECSDQQQIKSIAFPAIGTGVGEFPIGLSAETMIKAITNYIDNKPTKIERIILVAYNDISNNDFISELNKVM